MKRTSSGRGFGGRPPKFTEPSGPVTVTLPNRTLGQLQSIDRDRAKAIVKAVDTVVERGVARSQHAEVVEMAPGTGVVVVPPSRSLDSISWLKMIEVAPARFLLTITPGTPIEKVEIGLMDLVEDAKVSVPEEVPMLEALRGEITRLRRRERLSIAEILFVVM
jgi:hypothetical protein